MGGLVSFCGYLLRDRLHRFTTTQEKHTQIIAEHSERLSYVEGEISRIS